jgi:putative endonuclease
MYFFYLLRCRDNSLYAGITTDLTRRVEEHNAKSAKSAKYTRAKGPVILVYFETFKTKQEAMKREYEVKQWKKKDKELLILNQKLQTSMDDHLQ